MRCWRVLPGSVVAIAAIALGHAAAADPGTNPHTCFANAQVDGVQVHALCDEPAKKECLLKAQALGRQAEACEAP